MFLLRLVRSYHVLTACPPRPLRAYGVSFEIYALGNGDHGRSRGALTTIMGFLPRVFYVYRECTATTARFYHVLTATILSRSKFSEISRGSLCSHTAQHIWCSISKFWISSDMMMNTKYSDENEAVVVRTPWNRGLVEDPMKLPLQM